MIKRLIKYRHSLQDLAIKVGGATLLLGFLLPGPAMAQDGPFGVNIGDDPELFQNCTPDEKEVGQYNCTALPNVHPDFPIYQVLTTPQTGVCGVGAISSYINNDRSGNKAREFLRRIASQISSRYGQIDDVIDRTQPGTPSRSSDEWMHEISVGDRDFMYFWNREDSWSDTELMTIFIQVHAFNRSQGEVRVFFVGNNYERCQEYIEGQESRVFGG